MSDDLVERLEKASTILANDDESRPMTRDRSRRVFVTEAMIEARETLASLTLRAEKAEAENKRLREAMADCKDFVDEVAGENRPSRLWISDLHAKLNAVLALRLALKEGSAGQESNDG